MTAVGGWPMLGVDYDGDGRGEPVLGRQWQWNVNHAPAWYSLIERPGHLRLFARPAAPADLRDALNLLQKIPARRFRAGRAKRPAWS